MSKSTVHHRASPHRRFWRPGTASNGALSFVTAALLAAAGLTGPVSTA